MSKPLTQGQAVRFSAPNEDIAVLLSGFSGQDVNGFVHSHPGWDSEYVVLSVTSRFIDRSLIDLVFHRRNFVSVWPPLVPAQFKRWSRSPSQTCTPSPSGTPSRVSLP